MTGDRPLMSVERLTGDAERLPERVVMVFDTSLVPRRGRRRRPDPFRGVAVGRGNPEVAVVAARGPGAPTAAVTIELLAHLGAGAIVAVGAAGALTDLPTGSVHVVGAAVSDDGTSAHYGSDLRPDGSLTAGLAAALDSETVTALTTDAPLTLTAADVARHRQAGDVVEMEAAAVFAAARRRSVRAGAVLVVSDHYGDDDWYLGDPPTVAAALSTAVSDVVGALRSLDD
ncbi:MAG: hypothetical protein AAGA17_13630 [Actinomycetota bacterium]